MCRLICLVFSLFLSFLAEVSLAAKVKFTLNLVVENPQVDSIEIVQNAGFVTVNGHDVNFVTTERGVNCSSHVGYASSAFFKSGLNLVSFGCQVSNGGKARSLRSYSLYMEEVRPLGKRHSPLLMFTVMKPGESEASCSQEVYVDLSRLDPEVAKEVKAREQRDAIERAKRAAQRMQERLHQAFERLGKIKTPWGTIEEIYERNRGNCFTGETPVLVQGSKNPSSFAYKAIQDLRLGDKVWTCQFDSKSCELKKVRALHERQVDEVLGLTFVDQHGQEQEVEVTGEHPFNIGERRWQEARNLKVGARVYDILGKEIELIHTEIRQGIFFVYNLEVEGQDYDHNNYFVSRLGLLVHNCQIMGYGSVGLGAAMIGASFIGVGGIVLTAVPTALIGGGFIFIKIAHSQDFASAMEDAIVEAAMVATGSALLSRAEKGLLLAKRGKEGLGEVRRAGEKIIETAEKIGAKTPEQISEVAGHIKHGVLDSTGKVQQKIIEGIKKGEFKGKQLEIPLDDGSKLVFRRDIGPGNHHPLPSSSGKSVDHYNFEIQIPKANRADRFQSKYNLHIIADETGNIVQII